MVSIRIREALFAIIHGDAQPSGLLPVTLPANMDAVEMHCEDDSFDISPYRDSCGNTYAFGFGLNWSGEIRDDRTKKYIPIE